MRDSSCRPLLAKGSGSANSRITQDTSSPPLLRNESESDVKSPDKVLQHIPTQTERSPKMNNAEEPRKMKSSQSDNESISSADSGVRARYRKSVDPTITVKKLEEDKLAQIRLSKDKFLQEREENRFLDLLRMRSGKMPQRIEDPVPMLNRQDLPISRPLFGVVVHGKSIPSVTVDVTEVPFHENVLKVLERQFDIETAIGVQAFVWSAVLNCRHVIGVCPPGKGKTISYLPGLISQLGDPTTYMELPQGKGPLALILVPSWKKARDVFGKVEYFQKSGPHGMNQIRSIVLYAGGAEDNENTQMALLQGCEILIATPPSLCRMLDQDFTSLKRLCHIVFDDAEIVATRFFDEVYAIMQQYKLVLRDRRKQNVPRQIMIFSTQWHDGIEKFRLMYTKEPVIAISSRVEAAVYGNVKQVVITSKWEQRLSKFCGLLDSLATSSQRVASFTSDMSEALEMYQAAKSRGVYCLLIHEESTLETVTEVRNQWLDSSHSKQLIVIVSTDDCYQDLAITNATMVIHYGLPNSKTKFGNRLACMLDYFVDRTAERQADVEPVSHVILTDRCADRAQSLFEILQRCKAEYSPQLNEFLRGYQSGLDSDENRDFCPFLKSFGTCINRDKCEYRHVLIPRRDLKTGEISQNTLPSSGEIKIKVLEVVNASGYYCHLVEHRSATDNSRTDLRLVYQHLALDMVTFFSKESNQVPYVPSDNPREDGLCAFKDENDVYYRAKVLEVKEGTRAEPMKQCKVWLVDAGCYRYGTIDQLVKLSRRLAEVPYQAVEVYLCSLKPMDDDSEWTDKANMFVDELIRGKELVGRIMLRVGLTLWLMPLVHQRKLRGVGLVSDFNVRQELLANKYATVHTDHIQQLYELFRGKTDIPEKIMRQYYDYCLEVEMTQETLSSKEECHAVCIAAVIKPDLFYIHKWDKYEGLEQLEVKIAEWMVEENNNARDHKLDTDTKLENGSVCLALSSDGKWYRAKIVSDQTDGQWEVFFLDYGDRENVSDDMIRPLPRHLGELPCQVIECQLAYIKPKGEDWPVIAVGTMCDLSHFVNEDKKMLYAKVVDKTDASYTIGQRLVVDVHDTTDGDVRFSEELVRRHVAVCADSSAGITDLVGKPALKNQKFFNSLDRIPYLCANIYWCEDHEDALQQANELRQLMSIRIRGWDVALEQRGVLSSVVKVIGYIPNAEAHCILLDCLVSCCLKSARLCDIAIKENLATNLVCCLQQTSRPVIQHQAAQALSHLVELDSFCDAVHASSSVTSTLEQFLSWNEKTPVDLEVLKCICSTAAKLVRTSDESCCEELKSAEMMEQIYHYLVQTTKDAEREPWLELLAAIATWESTHSYMMREAHVAVIKDLLTKCQCVKCLYYILSVCRSLVLGSRKHKRMLLESKLLIDLKDLLNRDLKSPALEMCRELQAEMNLQLPQHEAMAGVPARQDHGTVRMTCPNVTWRQNCFRVILTVKVRNAKEDDFHITTTSVSCRSESEGVGYEFDWDLYDSILPDQSKITCHASETLIDLRKGAKGQWSRLLKQKCKVPNLSLNFDHPYDSDEEDVEDADDMSKLTQPKDVLRQKEILRVKRVGPYSSDEGSESDSFGSSENGEDPVADFD